MIEPAVTDQQNSFLILFYVATNCSIQAISSYRLDEAFS